MRLEKIQIKNFRAFKVETVWFNDYTCLVGPNGAGKSTVLTALNVFFRNNASTATNVISFSREDFHHCDVTEPAIITLTFKDLSPEAQEELKHYYRQGRLSISAKAVWDETTGAAEVRQYGNRNVMKVFAPYFKAVESGAKAAELKGIYDSLQEAVPDLPNATNGPARETALRVYEESHPELCEPFESETQFFGFTKGSNLLSKYVQWVYVPAVKDASTEQDENSKTALGQLLERTIRTQVNFKVPIAELKKELEDKYRLLVETEQQVLVELQQSMEARLQEWASPSAALRLSWHYDPNKTLVISEPTARAAIGEDNFVGEIARLGHGMQRSFLVALLHQLAAMNQEAGPTLILGFEEPELFQHPPQAQHMSALLEQLASTEGSNSQVVVSTHSPYFISSKGFENVRFVRKHPKANCSLVAQTTYTELENLITVATGDRHQAPTALMASIEQIMQPSQNELYFTRLAVLVEGIEDIAFIATHLAISGRWAEFRKHGCHFVIAAGKTNLSRPLAIAKKLCISTFTVFDGDCDCAEVDRERNKRDNTCILRLCGLDGFDPLSNEIIWHTNCVMWPSRIFDVVRNDLGDDAWRDAEAHVRREKGFLNGVKQKNNLLIAGVLEELAARKQVSSILDEVSDRILSCANAAREH